MSCATVTIKYLVFIFNTLCAMVGIGTIVVNSMALKHVSEAGRLVCIFFIVLGSVVFLISFLGSCGAVRENIWLTWTYAGLLLAVIIANSVLIFGFLGHLDGETHARHQIEGAWAYQLNGHAEIMAYMQSKLKCCGKLSAQDYVNSNLTIPASCYADSKASTGLFTNGCLLILSAVLERTELLIVIFSWITLSVEFVALVCACLLAITFRNQQRRANY